MPAEHRSHPPGSPIPPTSPSAQIVKQEAVIGLEIHVELATRRKMFATAPNLAHPDFHHAEPNTLIDPVTLGLPGALPVMNAAAVEMSMMVGMALGCSIAPLSRWDRKSYFYPDMPKNYQISQYPLPICFDGALELPPLTPDGKIDYDALAQAVDRAGHDVVPRKRIGIIRAHLEEDAGKLLHEAPGGHAIDGTLIDLNRAGTPLLEIVTQPDFTSADQVVMFCQVLRNICRFLGVSECVMQKGHIRFEPNINCVLTLDNGRLVKTPIVEVKNLNSFKAVRGAIEYELREQPARWRADGREMGPGAKSTRGWDDHAMATVLQRDKEDAQDYRYFPDPDLVGVAVDDAWRERVRAGLPELPLERLRRYIREFTLSPKEAAALTDERDTCLFFERTVEAAMGLGVVAPRAGKQAANFVLQSGAKRANERSTPDQPVFPHELGITADELARLIVLREGGSISSNAADEVFGLLCGESGASGPGGPLTPGTPRDPEAIARERGLLIVRNESALVAWCEQAIRENAKSADDVRAGKHVAVGRLVGAVMKLAGGAADAAVVREKLLEMLGGTGH